MLAECLTVTYNAVHYAEEHTIDNRRGMKGFYQTLEDIGLPSCYKVAVIARACAVVQSRRKSQRRGIRFIHPRPLRPMACVITGFFVTMKGRLFVPLRRDRYFDVQLNRHTLEALAGKSGVSR